MSRKRRPITISAIALFCLAVVLLLDNFAPFAYVHARALLRDAITRNGRPTPPNPDLVFLAIDSASANLEVEQDIEQLYGLTDPASTEARALTLMSQQWPWPREVHALILERLARAGAKVVLFDLMFPVTTPGDEPFRAALDQFRSQVVIGSNFGHSDRHAEVINATHTRPAESIVPQTVPMDDRVGYVNFWPDEDDVVRRATYRYRFNGDEFLSLGARALIKAGYADRVPDGFKDRVIRYTAPPGRGFPPRSIFEIFVPQYWEQNYQSGEFFRGKIVLVGAQGAWAHDEAATPFGLMAGPELHLNAINAALHRQFIREMSHTEVALIALLAAVLAVGLSLGVRSPWIRMPILAAVDWLDLWLALFAYDHLATFMACLPFLIVFNVTVLLGLACDFAWERLEKTRVRRTLEKYVSTNVVRELLDNPKQFEQSLGGVMKPVAVLFSDIRGYSTVSARTDPQALVTQLNEYLSAMVECVFRHGGTLDKFIGDAVMAVWGNVRSEGARGDATNAVRAALEMRSELARLNADWRARGLPELRVGIAVNQGDVVVGNIGSPRRMEFTVIGDVVNVSWKLQELTKRFEADLIVSSNVQALLVEDFDLQSLGGASVAGRDELVEVFAVLGPVDLSSNVAQRPLARV